MEAAGSHFGGSRLGAGTSIWVWIADQLCCRVLWSSGFVGRGFLSRYFTLPQSLSHGLSWKNSWCLWNGCGAWDSGSHQAVHSFPATEVGISGIWASRLAPKAINKPGGQILAEFFGGPDTARLCLNFCGSKPGSWGKNSGILTPECPWFGQCTGEPEGESPSLSWAVYFHLVVEWE